MSGTGGETSGSESSSPGSPLLGVAVASLATPMDVPVHEGGSIHYPQPSGDRLINTTTGGDRVITGEGSLGPPNPAGFLWGVSDSGVRPNATMAVATAGQHPFGNPSALGGNTAFPVGGGVVTPQSGEQGRWPGNRLHQNPPEGPNLTPG